MRNILSTRLYKALKAADLAKKRGTLDYIGVASAAEVWAHLQKQPTYEPWMTLDNLGQHRIGGSRGVWQIDHIVPLKYSGSAISEEDIKLRLHYTNLQPLRAVENVSKGNRRVGV